MSPVSSKIIFNALLDKNLIVLACNPRIIPGVATGIFLAAKDLDAAIIMELARSECDEKGGYTGLTPLTLSARLIEANSKIKHDIWALHADHIGIKTGDDDEIEATKKLIDMQVEAGYTSFAIDASHLFDFDGKTVKDELKPNLDATIKIARYIAAKKGDGNFGLEVEVGEIGRTNENGMILTRPEEAVTFINELEEAGVKPDVLAIANGSTHGNVYDKNGNIIAQVCIDIERTKAIAKALRDAGFKVRIAQHGITGTPLDLIREKFPKGDILKGNVATLFQNIVFDCIKIHQPGLYERMTDWVMENKPLPDKGKEEIFGKNGKFAIKQFFNEIYLMDEECRKDIEQKSYQEARNFIEAFNAVNSAALVRKSL
ncbi:class II fructose-bisphosphate aldolase [Candidatus Parcubacteria bacterium]|nr:MAG: class II fructose-bisphosphate aldolase [Candidatus Parcubacteria bacterium]